MKVLFSFVALCQLFFGYFFLKRSMVSKVNIQEKLHTDLRQLFRAGIEAVKPANLLRKTLHYEAKNSSLIVDGRNYILSKLVERKHTRMKPLLWLLFFPFCSNVHVVGFGKAVLGMAFELEKMIGQHIKGGILSVPFGSQRLANKEALTALEKRHIRYYTNALFSWHAIMRLERWHIFR